VADGERCVAAWRMARGVLRRGGWRRVCCGVADGEGCVAAGGVRLLHETRVVHASGVHACRRPRVASGGLD
jgi:hypothetical protein